MKKIQINIDWSVVFWMGVITLFLWLLARAAGLINTPFIIDLIPYAASFAALLGAVMKIARFVNKVENGLGDIKELGIRIDKIETITSNIRIDIHRLDKRVSIIETKI